MPAKFKVHDFYSSHFDPVEDDGIFLLKVMARTETTVTLQTPVGNEQTHSVFIAANGAEAVRPHGECPLSPVVMAR